jgi:hypothetical protein
MIRAISSISGIGEEEILFLILRSALYPVFFVGEVLRRLLSYSRLTSSSTRASAASVFTNTKEQASIVASYILMARGSL